VLMIAGGGYIGLVESPALDAAAIKIPNQS
jgi:hypothetical protein